GRREPDGRRPNGLLGAHSGRRPAPRPGPPRPPRAMTRGGAPAMLDSSGHPYLPRGAATGGNGSEEGMKHWKTLLSALLVVLLAACGTAALPGEPGGPDGEDDPKGPGKDPTNPGGPTNPVTSTRFFLFRDRKSAVRATERTAWCPRAA